MPKDMFLPVSKRLNGVVYSLRWRREKNKPPCINLRSGEKQLLQLPGWASTQAKGVEWALDILEQVGASLPEEKLAAKKAAFLKDRYACMLEARSVYRGACKTCHMSAVCKLIVGLWVLRCVTSGVFL